MAARPALSALSHPIHASHARLLPPVSALGSEEPDDSFVSSVVLREDELKEREKQSRRAWGHSFLIQPSSLLFLRFQISSEDAFKAHVASADVVVADFMARWCRKCIYIKVSGGTAREDSSLVATICARAW